MALSQFRESGSGFFGVAVDEGVGVAAAFTVWTGTVKNIRVRNTAMHAHSLFKLNHPFGPYLPEQAVSGFPLRPPKRI